MSLQPEAEPEDTPVGDVEPVPFARDDAPQDDYEENGTASPIDEGDGHGVPV